MDSYFSALLAVLNLVIAELHARDIKIYDADNRDYYLDKIEYSREDDKIVFLTDEDKQSLPQLSVYDNIIKLSSENSNLKVKVEDLIKLNEENSRVIRLLINQIERMNSENEKHNIGTTEESK